MLESVQWAHLMIQLGKKKFAYHARSKNPQHSHCEECARAHTWKQNYFPQFVEDTLVLWETWSQSGTEKGFIINILLFCFQYHLTVLITDIIIFSYDEVENKWIAKNQKYPDFRAVLRGSLLGPREWTVYNDSTVCSGSTSYRANLSLSFCSMDQFTCSNGYCVDIAERWVSDKY